MVRGPGPTRYVATCMYRVARYFRPGVSLVRGFRSVLHVALWCVLRNATAGLGDSYGERPQPGTI